ncbi:ATP synthase F1 subunit gamma [Aerococcaceae bacterium zg-ZUI334]|uniref:ATP synthase F1 subunit gamma n=1 Tax=Aerococcaceae bacterium zg-252 TaxID=2796928 RepID=UPI001B92FE01|nr:ATP synthase F1 subunit gamma [Aerococcaceae bacterium zg-ZUI334]
MSLNQIRKRIDSTRKTAQITNAMRMVSASKYNRMVQESVKYFEYAQKVKQMVAVLGKQQFDLLDDGVPMDVDEVKDINFNDLLIERPIKRTGYLIITSDKGLAGGYNTSIIKATDTMLKDDHQSKDEVVVLAIGEPIAKYCREEGYEIAYELHHLTDQPSFIEVSRIVRKAVKLFKKQVFDALYVCYNHHINAMTTQFRAEQILPLTDLELEEEIETSLFPIDFLIEPNQSALLDVLLPQYAESQIYGAIMDAKTSEHASRMNAMRSATDNAEEMIDDLKQQYHQQRQLKVTSEISEIISGANAQQ